MKTPFERSQIIIMTFGPNLMFARAIQIMIADSVRLEKLQGSLYRARETITDWKEVSADIIVQRREINEALATASQSFESHFGVSA